MSTFYPTVLAYHRISRLPLPAGTWVTPKVLGAQMDKLQDAGVVIANPQQWGPANDTGVLLTFDDGTTDLVEMGGVLARRGLRGMVFLPAGFVGRPNGWEWSIPGRGAHHLDRSQLMLLADLGWEIGLHGATHRDMTRMSPGQLDDEILGGRETLAGLLGRPVRFFSYPFGRCNEPIKKRLQEAGFAAAFIMAEKMTNDIDPFAIARRPIYCIDSPGDVLAKVLDPEGHSLLGRWQHWKERGAHGVGKLTAGWKKQSGD